MDDLDKMARELLAAELRRRGLGAVARAVVNGSYDDEPEHSAIRAALLTAPPGWKLVPIPPTDDMIEAAQEAHMPFGDMHFAITSAILAAPEPK